MSKRTRENYDAAIKLQLRNTPVRWRNNPIETDTGLARGVYRYSSAVDEESFGKALRGLDVRPDPSNPYAEVYKNLLEHIEKAINQLKTSI